MNREKLRALARKYILVRRLNKDDKDIEQLIDSFMGLLDGAIVRAKDPNRKTLMSREAQLRETLAPNISSNNI